MNRLSLVLAMAFAAPAAIAQCTLTAPGTQITPTPIDSWTAIKPIGFAFPFNGTTYTDCYISDHGLVALSNAGVPASPPSGAFTYGVGASSLVTSSPMIAAYWSDQNFSSGGLYIDNTNPTACTITWLNAETYFGLQPPFTTQVRLYANGRVEVLMDNRVNNQGSSFDLDAVVGMGAGSPAVLPAGSDLSVGVTTTDPTVFEQWTTSAPATPNPLFDVANRLITFAPTSPGWAVSTELLPSIRPTGTQITPTPVDGWAAMQNIGFAFPFNGTNYSNIHISDHGIVALSNAGVPTPPAGGGFTYTVTSASLAAGGPTISAYWSDANCNAANTVAGIFIDNTSGTSCTVTWWNSETYFNQRPPFTVQMTLFSDGHVTINIENRVTNNGSSFDLDAVIGMGNGAATPLPAGSDLSAGVVTASPTVFEQWTTTAASTPNPLFDVKDRTLTFYPTNPGWIVTNAPLGCASKQAFGTGCNGLALDSNNPVLGTNWNLTTNGIDPISPIAITFFGPSFPTGIPLTAIGINAPGCNAHLGSIFANLSAPNLGGTSVLPVTIPLSAALKGAVLSGQSLCLTTANPALMSTSNGVEGTVGY